MSCDESRRSKSTEAVKGCTKASVLSLNRPPQRVDVCCFSMAFLDRGRKRAAIIAAAPALPGIGLPRCGAGNSHRLRQPREQVGDHRVAVGLVQHLVAPAGVVAAR